MEPRACNKFPAQRIELFNNEIPSLETNPE